MGLKQERERIYIDGRGRVVPGWTEKIIKSGKMVEKSSDKGKIKSKEMLRKSHNTGAFKHLPERMSKKHIREIAKEFSIDLEGLSLSIDFNEDLLRIPFAGRADSEKIGGVTFFPNSFRSKEELARTIFHEKQHVEQFKEFGVEFVQANREYFEKLTEVLEEEFVMKAKKEGEL